MSSEVFVLGAGFTHAFFPDAPLMVDDYDSSNLLDKFKDFPIARQILQVEINRNQNGQINIERLMTRLHSGMPYDSAKSQTEFSLLFSGLKEALLERLAKTKKGTSYLEELAIFAQYCVDQGAICISFNYDDVLDQALWEVKKLTEIPLIKDTKYWHPDGGYGFFCRPSICCVKDTDVNMDKTSMHLLKLHGSVNWHPKFGSPEPHTTEALLHHEQWLPIPPFHETDMYDLKAVENHLAEEPFIVPPVLQKSDLIKHPVIRLVWHLAYRALTEARQVTFIGYSLPLTDISSGFLFGEALQSLPASSIKVVNLLSDKTCKKNLMNTYQKVLPQVTHNQFDFRDALEWSRDLPTPITDNPPQSKVPNPNQP